MLLHAVTLASLALAATAKNKTTLPPIPKDKSSPVQQRLAFDGPGTIAVSWSTYEKPTKAKVFYGLAPHQLCHSAESTHWTTYETSRTWSSSVKLEGLQPGTKYYYKIDSTNSSVDSFETARAAGDHTPYTVALVVDMGVFGPDGLSYENETWTGTAITDSLTVGDHTTIDDLYTTQDKYSFIVHPGDFAYADHWIDEIEDGVLNASTYYSVNTSGEIYEGLNEQFWNQYGKITKLKPLMVSVGNHEDNCDETYTGELCPPGQQNFTGFIDRFKPSYDQDTGPAHPHAARKALPVSPMWYSYDNGMVHYVHLTTETDLMSPNGTVLRGNEGGQFGRWPGEQVEWLEADLAAVDRKKTPWIVVSAHRPHYVNGGDGNGADEASRQSFEPALCKYGVDLVLQGHVHNQELIGPICNNTMDPNGLDNPSSPLYVINGAAGHWEGLSPKVEPQEDFVRWMEVVYGYSLLHFRSKDEVTIDFYASGNHTLIHSVTLHKKH